MKKNEKPIIGIVSKPVKYKEEPIWQYDELVDDLRYIMIKNGAIAIGILPTSNTMEFNNNDELDNTVLSQNELQDLYAIKVDKPMIGICAGFNNLIRALGGNVTVDSTGKHNVYSKNIVHSIKIDKNSKLYTILKEESIEVNSIHTMIANDSDIKEFKITAHSEDGLVEAIELDNKKFVLGMKWHPEIMLDINPKMNDIFKEFIKACK